MPNYWLISMMRAREGRATLAGFRAIQNQTARTGPRSSRAGAFVGRKSKRNGNACVRPQVSQEGQPEAVAGWFLQADQRLEPIRSRCSELAAWSQRSVGADFTITVWATVLLVVWVR